MQKLINNLRKMNNAELIGLAKNRFIPPSLQMGLAKTEYRRAQEYLAANEGLAPSVRDYLWTDEVNRGYSMKAALVAAGQYADVPEKYWELYDRYPRMWQRSRWRTTQCFLGIWSWRNPGGAHTPTDLLHEIYQTHLKNDEGNQWYKKTTLLRLADHENCDINLAIMLSTCGIEKVQKRAFEKIVELSQ
jgi:hypothetical protein